MSLKVYIFLLFGISIALFFTGYQPLLFSLLQCPTTSTTCVPSTSFASGFLNSASALIANPGFLAVTVLAIFVPFLVGGSFSVYYIIPILLLFALSNFLLLPTDFLLQSSMPWQISAIILGFMNLLLLLTVVEFVRGGD